MVKNLPALQETWVRSPGWEDSLEEGMANHSSFLAWRIPIDRGAWWATVHGVPESDMTERLQFLFSLSCIEKEMATHSTVLAWKIPGIPETGGLTSMETQRVGHD